MEMVAFLPLAPKIYRLAEQQNGHVCRRQLLALGLAGSGVQHLIEAGLLVPSTSAATTPFPRHRRQRERAVAHVTQPAPPLGTAGAEIC
jgi:hypothetical protein